MAAVDDPLRPRSPDEPARGAAFALVAHAVLIGALSLGVSWRMSTPEGGSAELWSSVPQIAAPQEPANRPDPTPRPAPPQPREEPPPPRQERPADLAEKPEPRRKPEPKAEPRPKPERELPRREPEPDPKRKTSTSKSREEPPKADKPQPGKDERKPAPAKTPALQSDREEALRRIMGQAGGQDASTGAPRQGANAPGKGISDSYAGRIVARVRPNVVFPPVVDGNPKAEVEVRAAADGRIVSRRITQSSGVPAWDDAVLRALDRTEVLPLNEDGRMPSPLILTFRPRDF